MQSPSRLTAEYKASAFTTRHKWRCCQVRGPGPRRPWPKGTRPPPIPHGWSQAPTHTLCGFARRRRGRSCRAAFPAALLRTPRAAAPLRCARPLRRAGPAPRASCAPPPAPALGRLCAGAPSPAPRALAGPAPPSPGPPPARAAPAAAFPARGALGVRVASRGARLAPPGFARAPLRPRPPGGLAPALSPLRGAGAWFAARAACRACCAFPAGFWRGWGSPLRPPRPAVPAGDSGGPGACSRLPEVAHLCRRPPSARGPTVGGLFGPVDSPEIVNQGLHEKCDRGFCRSLGLDFPRFPWYADVPEPVRAPMGAALVGVHARRGKRRLVFDQAALFCVLRDSWDPVQRALRLFATRYQGARPA